MGETKGKMCNLTTSPYYVTESQGGYYKQGQMAGWQVRALGHGDGNNSDICWLCSRICI